MTPVDNPAESSNFLLQSEKEANERLAQIKSINEGYRTKPCCKGGYECVEAVDYLVARVEVLEQVAEAATRVLETQEAIWLLDEADNNGEYWLLREGMDQEFQGLRASLDALAHHGYGVSHE